jgi:hypothetical protein
LRGLPLSWSESPLSSLSPSLLCDIFKYLI